MKRNADIFGEWVATDTGFAFSQAPGVRDVMVTLGLAPAPSEKKQERTNNKGKEEDLEEHAGGDEERVRESSRRGAREEERFHDDLMSELNHNY
jgi:hypothetical protein